MLTKASRGTDDVTRGCFVFCVFVVDSFTSRQTLAGMRPGTLKDSILSFGDEFVQTSLRVKAWAL